MYAKYMYLHIFHLVDNFQVLYLTRFYSYAIKYVIIVVQVVKLSKSF